MKQAYKIREIRLEDNSAVEVVIRSCLIEFGANHAGTAWEDPDLGRFSEIYCSEGNKYWVAVGSDGEIVGGTGIGALPGFSDICELQKMYCLTRISSSSYIILMDSDISHLKSVAYAPNGLNVLGI